MLRCFHNVFISPFSTLLFRCRRRKIMTAKLYFCVPSPLKKLVLALQSLKMSCFYFTFCSWSYKTTNKVSGWRNFSPATAKYVSGKRAIGTLPNIHILSSDIFYGNKNLPSNKMSGRSKVVRDKT